MKKIFVDKIAEDNILTGDDHAHVSVVLRARVGDKLVLCDGDGFDYLYEIAEIDKKSTRLRLISKTESEGEPTARVDLFCALLKSDKLEWVCQKCTELGINAIRPFTSEYVQVKSESFRAERARKICKEAAQQCGRGKVPLIYDPVPFEKMTTLLEKYDNVVFLYENGGDELPRSLGTKRGSTAVIVGSEGGFDVKERDRLVAMGVRPISLGKRILRAETACVVAVALVMYEMGELR